MAEEIREVTLETEALEHFLECIDRVTDIAVCIELNEFERGVQ